MRLGPKIEHHHIKTMLYKMLYVGVHKVKTNSLYPRPKQSSNNNSNFTKIEIGKKEFNIPTHGQ